MYELNAIERACRHIGGGLQSLVMIDPDDVDTIPPYYLLPNISAVVLLPGATAKTLSFERGEAELNDTTVVTDPAGDYIDYVLNARVKNFTLDVQWLRSKLLNRRIHVAATYMDGTQVLLQKIRLRPGHSSGKRRSDKNGYLFTGTLRLPRPIPTIDTVIVGSGGSGLPDPTPGASTGVDPVIISTDESTYTYTIPGGTLLLAIYVKSASAQTVAVGTTVSGDELGGPAALSGGQYGLFGSNLLRPDTDTPIYFSGLAGTNTIELWILGNA